jgi:hypothetical protein
MRETEPDYQRTALDSTDEWHECRPCHYSMLKLREYEISNLSDAPALEPSESEFFFFGWAVYVWGIVLRYAWGTIGLVYRKRKLAQEKSNVLPAYPNSLVCPKCLRVERRR